MSARNIENKQVVGITGASGLLGTTLIEVLSKGYKVQAAARHIGYQKPNVEWSLFDLNETATLQSWLESTKPQVVIHCAALTNVDACEKNKDQAIALHQKIPETILSIIKKWDGHFIYISTDAVFDGRLQRSSYREEDLTNPLNIYGQTKCEGERIILSEANSLVVRTNLFGWNYSEKFSFAEWLLKGLVEQAKLTMFTDVFFSPLHVLHLSSLIEQLIKVKMTGLLHIAASNVLSKYEFAIEMAKIFNLNSENIIPISVDEFKFEAERPKNMSLSSGKASNFGFYLPSIQEGIELMKEQYGSGWLGLMKGFKVSEKYHFWERI